MTSNLSQSQPRITVLHGGTSDEREVSLVSGRAVADALRGLYEVDLVDWRADTLPEGLDPKQTVIFPALHGGAGEDGRLQAQLEAQGFAYVGSDAASSALCMDKQRTKETVSRVGVPIAAGVAWHTNEGLDLADTLARLGPKLVIKPRFGGSSIGLVMVSNLVELQEAVETLPAGDYVIEERIAGRELSIGVLNGEPLVVVEIVPRSGVYDYQSKYTAGATEYRYPAELSAPVTQRVRALAKAAFHSCHCRDVARVDFLLREDQPYFLEVNTLPGLTPTSLLPKSAAAHLGLDFPTLVNRLLQPALLRFSRQGSAE
ncbi:MAG: D-alanine--D-alanine ligase [Verrucomicrobiota bacterium JB022]|nr:D-alanine--D-alanine ligase [Verrucomicrobiota bacterium JB022]